MFYNRTKLLLQKNDSQYYLHKLVKARHVIGAKGGFVSKVEGTMSRSPTPTLVNHSKLLAKSFSFQFPYPTRGLRLHVRSGPPCPSISLYIYSPFSHLSPPQKHTLPPFHSSSPLKQHSPSSFQNTPKKKHQELLKF